MEPLHKISDLDRFREHWFLVAVLSIAFITAFAMLCIVVVGISREFFSRLRGDVSAVKWLLPLIAVCCVFLIYFAYKVGSLDKIEAPHVTFRVPPPPSVVIMQAGSAGVNTIGKPFLKWQAELGCEGAGICLGPNDFAMNQRGWKVSCIQVDLGRHALYGNNDCRPPELKGSSR